MHLENLVGQHLMLGITGTAVTPDMIRVFQATRAGGLIVFRRNFESAVSFRRLLSDLEKALDRRLLVAVDHEGGRVIHLSEGVTFFPDNWVVGNTGREESARRQGEIEARELRRLGIDLNLSPVVDVLGENFSPNIGIRAYGTDPEKASRLAVSRITGMQTAGLSACAKHFPGQGQSPMDAHQGLPFLATSWEEFTGIHLKPFEAAARAGVHAFMSSHPVYPDLDPTSGPATFSRRLIHDFVRGTLHYDGLILSDDLEMGALSAFGGMGERAKRAVAAGHDMVLICRDPEAQIEAYERLLKAYLDAELDRRELKQSVIRIERLKEMRPERFLAGAPEPEPEGAALAREIAAGGLTVRMPAKFSASPAAPAFVIFPRLSKIAQKFAMEEGLLHEEAFIQRVFKECGLLLGASTIVELEAGTAQMASLGPAETHAWTVFFCYDAHLDAATRRMLEWVQVHAKACAVVLLRDPYDAEWVKEQSLCITAYGYRQVQIEAAVRALAEALRSQSAPAPAARL